MVQIEEVVAEYDTLQESDGGSELVEEETIFHSYRNSS
jgi:hypothetical protein